MPLQSDIVIDVAKFHPGAVSEQTKKFNERLIEIFEGAPKWWEVRHVLSYQYNAQPALSRLAPPSIGSCGTEEKPHSRRPLISLNPLKLLFPHAKLVEIFHVGLFTPLLARPRKNESSARAP